MYIYICILYLKVSVLTPKHRSSAAEAFATVPFGCPKMCTAQRPCCELLISAELGGGLYTSRQSRYLIGKDSGPKSQDRYGL